MRGKFPAANPIRLNFRICIVCLIPLVCANAIAYNFDGNDRSANNGRPKWAGSTVTYRFNQNTNSAHSNITAGSNPKVAVNQGFSEWASEAGVGFSNGADTSVANGGVEDGINLITFQRTTPNQTALNGDFAGGGYLGITLFYTDANNNITDADIIFSSSAPMTTFTRPTDPNKYPIQALATHEIGHFLGLEHSAVWSATMWPYLGFNGVTTESEYLANSLSHDDRAGINQLYPKVDFTPSGAITGTVRLSGQKVYGAHVVAVNGSNGIVYGSNLTLGFNQGSNYGVYLIQGLPAGFYAVYAEPMDGPTYTGNWSGASAGDWWNAGSFTTDFQTTFYSATVFVNNMSLQTVDIDVTPGQGTINPLWTAFSPDGQNFPASFNLALLFQPGTTRWIAVLGDGMDSVASADITCSDPGIQIDTTGRTGGFIGSIPWTIFRVGVPPNALGGPRNLIFRIGGEVAVLTGGIDVDAPEYNGAKDDELFD